MKDGPFKTFIDSELSGIIRQELITYRIQDGVLKREIVTRSYFEEGDYNDSTSSLPLLTMH